ncbi:MAG: prepilin-type N-terminal cleavage/methylation domain-containing protein [Firmicutes bacterium]|nr:prepilin-type N-terminal cleavage/methylation domain-containing protein [Bacillota bacterium]
MIRKLANIFARCREEKGFTLVELMIVAVIIGILAAIAVPQFVNATDKAKESRVQADLKMIADALERYQAAQPNSKYPATGSIWSELNGTYLKGASGTALVDPWGHDYQYVADTNRKQYIVYSYGPDGLCSTASEREDDWYVMHNKGVTKGDHVLSF